MVALIKGRAADVVDTALDLGILPGFKIGKHTSELQSQR
jgi:hypothetical protein